MPVFRVTPKNKIQTGSTKKGDKRTYEPGETLQLSEEEAAKMPWAVELVREEKKKN